MYVYVCMGKSMYEHACEDRDECLYYEARVCMLMAKSVQGSNDIENIYGNMIYREGFHDNPPFNIGNESWRKNVDLKCSSSLLL